MQKIIDEYLLNWINNQIVGVFVSYERLVWYPCNLIIKKFCKNQKLFFFNYYSRYQENIVNENNQNPIVIPCKKINMIFSSVHVIDVLKIPLDVLINLESHHVEK